MRIFITNKNIKTIINTKDYQSINSVINEYLILNNINDNLDNFFLDYNGIYLNSNFSLEKYNIENESILNLNIKNKGGSSIKIILIVVGIIISLLPIFILPLGFIPLTSSLIKAILEKSTATIGKYLVCTLGKITLYSRMKGIIFIIKYIIFILMIYIVITFPLILLCISLKGKTVIDNPKSICGAISAGSTAGIIVTSIYVFIYIFFRSGNYVLGSIINLFKNSYMLNMNVNPFLSSLLIAYNNFKYTPFYAIPILGQGLAAYFQFLSVSMPSFKILLSSITQVGCKRIELNKNAFMKNITSEVTKNFKDGDKKQIETNNKTNKENNKEDNNDETKKNKKLNNNEFCEEDYIKCCEPANFEIIADALSLILTNSISSEVLKKYNVYSAFSLFTEGFYESALSQLSNSENLNSLNYEGKRIYLRKLLDNKSEKIPPNLKESINNFLEGNNSILSNIKDNLNDIFPNESPSVNEIKFKLATLERNMIEYSKENKSHYVPGASLFKTVFKIIFLDIFCNVVTTTKSSEDIILKMGEMKEIVDMLQAGSVTGLVAVVCYLIALIILIICGIFQFY